MSAMYQFSTHKLAADLNKPRPINVIIGAITRGPMNRSITPINPVVPIITYTSVKQKRIQFHHIDQNRK